MPRIVRTRAADSDLGRIWFSIAESNSPMIADAMLARVFGAMDVLASAPLIGRKRADLRGSPRSLAVKPYTIVYEPLPDGDGIYVWRVLHGARDLQRIVKRPRGKK